MILFDSEKSLENFIVEEFALSGKCIVDEVEYDNLVQQMNIGSYGIPDLVFYKQVDEKINDSTTISHMMIHVVELKNEAIKMGHLSQIGRYKKYFDRAFEEQCVEVRSSLVVPKSVKENEDVVWIIDHIEEIDVIEFTLSPRDGIKFKKSEGWYKTDEDFKPALDLFGIKDEEF